MVCSDTLDCSARALVKGRQIVELVEHADEIDLAPVLDQQAVLEMDQVESGNPDRVVSWGDAHDFAAMRAAPGHAGNDGIVSGDHLLNGDGEIGECISGEID